MLERHDLEGGGLNLNHRSWPTAAYRRASRKHVH